jgi:hypothetical protein
MFNTNHIRHVHCNHHNTADGATDRRLGGDGLHMLKKHKAEHKTNQYIETLQTESTSDTTQKNVLMCASSTAMHFFYRVHVKHGCEKK